MAVGANTIASLCWSLRYGFGQSIYLLRAVFSKAFFFCHKTLSGVANGMDDKAEHRYYSNMVLTNIYII